MESGGLCGVNALFNTSAGFIAILDFQKGINPKVGMMLKNTTGRKWKIISISLGKPQEMTNFTFIPRFNNWLTSCSLEPADHSDSLNENDILEIV